MLAQLRGGLSRAFPPVPPVGRRERLALLVIVAVGALARLVWVLAAAEKPQGLSDPGLYMNLAEQFADGNGYSYLVPHSDGSLTSETTGYYPPGYPLVLGALLWLVELLPLELSRFGVAIAFNLVLSVATIALVFELGRRLKNVKVGLAAAAVVACWPNLIFHTGVILTETMFLFLLVLALLVVLASPEVARSPGWRRMVVVGLLLGAVGMVRPTSLVVAPLVLLLWWRSGVVTALRRTALVGAAMLVMILPWTVRNAIQMDSPVLISTNMGDNLCIGHHPDATGAYDHDFVTPHYCFVTRGDAEPQAQALIQSLPAELQRGIDDRSLGGPVEGETRGEFEVRRQGETVDRALRSIRHDPTQVVTSMPSKLRHTLEGDADGLFAAAFYGQRTLFAPDRMDTLDLLADAYYIGVGLVGVAGMVLLVRQDDAARRGLFLVLASLVQLVPPLLTFGDARFKMPIYPAVAIGAGMAAVWLFDRLRAPTPTADQTAGERPSEDAAELEGVPS